MKQAYSEKQTKTILINKVIYLPVFICLFHAWSCSHKSTNPPILIIATNSNFGTYTSEILKTEGYNEFVTDSPGSKNITSSFLKKFDYIVLAESRVDARLKKILEKYVRNGGNLIAFRPDIAISEFFGINPTGGYIDEGYIAIDTTTNPGKGITPEVLQFHGMADKYSISNATSIAHMQADESSPDRYPGVVSASYGEGHTTAFLYNLPKSVVYTRQGNPLSAGLEKDGIKGIRGIVDRSLNDQVYSVVSIKAHNSMYYFSKEPLMKVLSYAKSRGIPVWTALNLLRFLKMKDEASFSNLNWSNDRLTPFIIKRQ